MRWGQEHAQEIHEAAHAYLRAVQLRTGGPVRSEDVRDFVFEDVRIPLMPTGRGINKPRSLEAALSFTTVYSSTLAARPYDDAPGPDGLLRYKWQGFNPDQFDNAGLRRSMEWRLPLIWFWGIESGLYVPLPRVWLIGEERDQHQFVVALDADQRDQWIGAATLPLDLQRRYAQRTINQRLHQPLFRQRVLTAYGVRCAICRLRHAALLEAAHIRADADEGPAAVSNGIALCSIHHDAYDQRFIGIDADAAVHVRPDLMDEVDGPMLRHGFQELNGTTLLLPAQRAARPDRDLLAARFADFLGR